MSSSQFSFPMGKCAVALLCCAFSIEPLFAQELDWPYFGADVYDSRFQNIDLINPSNVSELKVAWSFTGGTTEQVSAQATPLVVDGVMYITGNNGGVFALNPTTGKQIWHYTPSPAGGASKGVAYGQGLIFFGQATNLVALNAKTGAFVWKTLVEPAKGANITIAPLFIRANKGTVPEVLIGPSPADIGYRGHMDAYSAATGKLLWRFYTVDPNTYPSGATLSGAGTWQTPTFDPTLNMIYFGTGNPSPDLGVNREGTNLYSCSIVALDATTGELQWYFQMIHHDLWDFDSAQPLVLFSWNGIPAVEGTTKAGSTYILDRANGKALIPYKEVAVPPTPANAAFQHPWPTQPVSSMETLAQQHVNPWSVPAGDVAVPMFTTPSPALQVFQPDLVSGYEWPSAAYSPRTHMIYSHAIYHPSVFQVENVPDSANCLGIQTSVFYQCGITSNQYSGTLGVDSGVYGAVDTLTGKVAWSIPILTSTPSSGMTVAGDLVFFADASGLVYAASAATGEILWVYDALTVPGASGADSTGPAVYEIGGVEYVAIEMGGYSLVEPTGGPYGPTGNALIAFAIPPAKAAAAAKANAK
jgi:PQQ-dependent dehydrogenase (methanol/ethanol family)